MLLTAPDCKHSVLGCSLACLLLQSGYFGAAVCGCQSPGSGCGLNMWAEHVCPCLQGWCKSTLQCHGCQQLSLRFELFTILELPIPSGKGGTGKLRSISANLPMEAASSIASRLCLEDCLQVCYSCLCLSTWALVNLPTLACAVILSLPASISVCNPHLACNPLSAYTILLSLSQKRSSMST